MMSLFSPAADGQPLQILCVGAHADDIEIGCGGTLLTLIGSGRPLHIEWCVLSAADQRRDEAQAAASDFLSGAASANIHIARFEDSYFPEQSREIKQWLIERRASHQPQIVFTHRANDAHQDHRVLNGLIWNLYRDQTILEFEIPKWDGDLGQPNLYAALAAPIIERKIALLLQHFGSQRGKDWFDAETFRGLARLRGMECRAPDNYAEGFQARKLRLL